MFLPLVHEVGLAFWELREHAYNMKFLLLRYRTAQHSEFLVVARCRSKSEKTGERCFEMSQYGTKYRAFSFGVYTRNHAVAIIQRLALDEHKRLEKILNVHVRSRAECGRHLGYYELACAPVV